MPRSPNTAHFNPARRDERFAKRPAVTLSLQAGQCKTTTAIRDGMDDRTIAKLKFTEARTAVQFAAYVAGQHHRRRSVGACFARSGMNLAALRADTRDMTLKHRMRARPC